MRDAILNFHKQFSYKPEIINGKKLKRYEKYIILGMGGSHLAADLLCYWNPYLDVTVHEDYGLPGYHDDVLKNSLIIASSYSGNTEEVLDGMREAREKNFPLAVISVGGKLIEIAKKEGVPYVQMPNTGIQPRSALGFSLKALFKILGEEAAREELEMLELSLHPDELEIPGKALAEKLRGSVPVIYTSRSNRPIAYNWKIKFNETGKIPAFYNVVPEMNHNEMTGFDIQPNTKELAEKFYFILIKDAADHDKVIKRMDVLEKLYLRRGLKIEIQELHGRSQFEKVFSSLLLADWAAYYTAEQYGLESEQVPMVEEFKRLIA